MKMKGVSSGAVNGGSVRPRVVALPSKRSSASSPKREEVARKAFDLFVKRGSVHGHDLEDWLEAERQLGVKMRQVLNDREG